MQERPLVVNQGLSCPMGLKKKYKLCIVCDQRVRHHIYYSCEWFWVVFLTLFMCQITVVVFIAECSQIRILSPSLCKRSLDGRFGNTSLSNKSYQFEEKQIDVFLNVIMFC